MIAAFTVEPNRVALLDIFSFLFSGKIIIIR